MFFEKFWNQDVCQPYTYRQSIHSSIFQKSLYETGIIYSLNTQRNSPRETILTTPEFSKCLILKTGQSFLFPRISKLSPTPHNLSKISCLSTPPFLPPQEEALSKCYCQPRHRIDKCSQVKIKVRHDQVILEIFHTSGVLDNVILFDVLKYMGFGNICDFSWLLLQKPWPAIMGCILPMCRSVGCLSLPNRWQAFTCLESRFQKGHKSSL